MTHPTIRLAALLGAITVVIGAFGAHGLKPHFSAYQIDIFEKGVQYQFYHVLAILLCGVIQLQFPEKKHLQTAVYLFVAGVVCFSGSLYLLASADILPFSVRWAGPVTPLGGLCFIGGWLMLLKK
jgi:uncharacterized membrane protein YgdD (TMEM256/DUF423 family)